MNISPEQNPDVDRSSRKRKQPSRLELSPGGGGAMRKEKVQKRLEVSYEERVPDINYIANARVTGRALEKLGWRPKTLFG